VDESLSRENLYTRGAQNRVVELNVGGTILSTTASTLRSIEGSALDKLMTDVEQGGWIRDPKGRLFLDRDPALFEVVLRCLRNPELRIHNLRQDLERRGVDMAALIAELQSLGLSKLIGDTSLRDEKSLAILLLEMKGALKNTAASAVSQMVQEALERASKPIMAKMAGIPEGDLFPPLGSTQTTVEGDLFDAAAWQDIVMHTDGFNEGEQLVAKYSRDFPCLKDTCHTFYFLTNLGRHGKFGNAVKDGVVTFPKIITVTGRVYPLTKEYIALAGRVVGRVAYRSPVEQGSNSSVSLWEEFMSVYREMHTGLQDVRALEIAMDNLNGAQAKALKASVSGTSVDPDRDPTSTDDESVQDDGDNYVKSDDGE